MRKVVYTLFRTFHLMLMTERIISKAVVSLSERHDKTLQGIFEEKSRRMASKS